MTSALQPNDQLLNRALRIYVINQYEDFYTTEFLRQLRLANDDATKVSIEVRLPAIKDKHATWIINVFNQTGARRSVIQKSWQLCWLLAGDAKLADDDEDVLSLSNSIDSETHLHFIVTLKKLTSLGSHRNFSQILETVTECIKFTCNFRFAKTYRQSLVINFVTGKLIS